MTLQLNNGTSNHVQLDYAAGGANHTQTFPQASGTLALTSDIPSSNQILQVVRFNTTTRVSNATTTWTNVLNTSITTQQATSQILVLASIQYGITTSTISYVGAGFRLLRNGTTIESSPANATGPFGEWVQASSGPTSVGLYQFRSYSLWDNHGQAAGTALSYVFQGRVYETSSTLTTNGYQPARSYITLMEVST